MPTEAFPTFEQPRLPGFDEWISSVEERRAKILAVRATEVASMVLRAAFGTSSPDSLARLCQRGSSSKTLLQALLDGSTLSEANWQSSAMRRYRSRLQQEISALHTYDPESLLLPTAVASSGSWNQGGSMGKEGQPIRLSLEGLARYAQMPTMLASHPEGLRDRKGKKVFPPSLPTLTTNPAPYSRRRGKVYHGLLPTLKSSEEERGGRLGRKNREGGPTLREALLPTLCSRDEKSPGPAHSQGGADLPKMLGGHLNPTWCLWFMNFPVDWLDGVDVPRSARSATPARQRKRKSSGM